MMASSSRRIVGPSQGSLLSFAVTTCIFSTLISRTAAHEHHMEDIPEGAVVSTEPLDTTLWLHIGIQILAFGLIFPTGMVLGIIRSRWHVPVQVTGTVLAILGYFLGHAHGGRQFAPNIHAKFSFLLMLLLIVQVGLGIYLRLHLVKAGQAQIRKWIIPAHGFIGKAMPLVSWVQMLFGGITALGFCREDHLGQCLAHFIMGSAFIAYGIMLTILLLVGQAWLRRTGRSQEFFDSLVIAVWGCINTFTEHRWGVAWGHNDLQHTSMGIVWWCAGLVGIWLSRNRDGSPKRNVIPGIVIFITGYAMSSHPQSLHLSTMVHTVFGYTLMGAGLTRIIEISFILRDRANLKEDGTEANSWQYVPTFLLYASGFMFLGATEEQMLLLSDAGVSHVSYVLILYSLAFLTFLFVHMLLHLYAVHEMPSLPIKLEDHHHHHNHNLSNGHARQHQHQQQDRVRDAEEFELEGLMSEDDSVDSPQAPHKRTEHVA